MNNYKFSKKSLEVLGTVEMELRVLMKEALKTSEIDFAVTEGYRSLARQQELYRRGRDGKGGKIVTYKDGERQRSKHQDRKAVDVVPYVDGKYDWNDIESYQKIVKNILDTAYKLKIKVRSGSSWRIADWPHIELI